MDKEKTSQSEFFVSEATFIGILTIGAYLITFAYNYGYLSAFGIPPELIKISIEHVFIVAIGMSLFFGIILIFVNTVMISIPEHPLLERYIFRWTAVLLIPLGTLCFYGARKQDLPLYIGLFIYFLLDIIFPIIINRNEKSILQRLVVSELKEVEILKKGIPTKMASRIGGTTYDLCYIIIMVAFVSYTAGMARAKTSKEHYILADNPNIAVVKVYSDMLICVPFDEKTREIKETIIIKKIGENGKYEFISKNIGPFKFDKSLKESEHSVIQSVSP